MTLQHLNIDKNWSLFLDRDGVINRRIVGDYVKKWEEFKFTEGALDAIKICNSIFNKIVVVTNQQGIAKGFYTTNDLNTIHDGMLNEIKATGGRIDKVYFCPELDATNAPCRKPNTGMGLAAKNDFPEIDFSKSIMVGDSLSDLEFGKKLGMKTIFISNEITDVPTNADFIFYSLKDFALALSN